MDEENPSAPKRSFRDEQIEAVLKSDASTIKLSIELLLTNVRLNEQLRGLALRQVLKTARQLRVQCLLASDPSAMRVRVKHESSLVGEEFIDIDDEM